MRLSVILCAALSLAGGALPEKHQTVSAQPDQFEIGRQTFWDFGPPFNYYDLFVVRPSAKGSEVTRIILTPPGVQCLAPAKIEVATAVVDSSPSALLGSMNPCAIPEKVLQRKPKGCKHCARYSGAYTAMRVRCGTQSRIIRSDIFEDYWFNPAAKPPKNTASILQLLSHLDYAVGPGVMDKPMITLPDDHSSPPLPRDTGILGQLERGEYDELFGSGPEKPSDLYKAAQTLPPVPTVRLVEILPIAPEDPVLPKYPPIARATRTEGQVTFIASIDSNGALTNVVFVNGQRFLQWAVQEAMNSWRFPKDGFNQEIHGTVEFLLNCHVSKP